jgi:hypothetical protein
MKKNLLTLAFAVALMCAGTGVSEAKTPILSTNNFKIEQNKGFNANKLKSINPSNAEFKKKYAELKELCKNNIPITCTEAILTADLAAVIAWGICLSDPGSCYDAQQWALEVLEWAMEICRNEPQIALVESIEERKANLNKEALAFLNKKRALAQ